MGDLAAGGGDLDRRRIVHPADQVCEVDANVEEGAAADAGQPLPAGEVFAAEHDLGVADFGRLDAALDGARGAGEADGKVDHQFLAGFLHGFVDAQAVGGGHGHRLFEVDVLAGLERGEGQLGVGAVGGGDGDDLNVVIREDAVGVCRVVAAFELFVVAAGGLFVDIAEGVYVDIGRCDGPPGMGVADAAATDEGPAEGLLV